MTVDWDFGLLESLIQDRGDTVVVERGMACPACRNEDPYAVNVTIDNRPATVRSMSCGTCFGNGYIYRNPRAVKGLITSVKQGNHVLQDTGFSSPGECIFSPSLAADYIAEGDRITFTNPTQVDKGQLILRGIANSGNNIFLKTDLLPEEDRLWYLPESIQWCEDSNGVVYYPGVDFVLKGNKISWINSPEIGTTYVIKYRAYMEWLVSDSPQERFDSARNLAQKVVLKKKHVTLLTSTIDPSTRFTALKTANSGTPVVINPSTGFTSWILGDATGNITEVRQLGSATDSAGTVVSMGSATDGI